MGFKSDSMGYEWDVPSGNVKQFVIENGSFIEDLPVEMVIFYGYARLPEGRWVMIMNHVIERIRWRRVIAKLRPSLWKFNITIENHHF